MGVRLSIPIHMDFGKCGNAARKVNGCLLLSRQRYCTVPPVRETFRSSRPSRCFGRKRLDGSHACRRESTQQPQRRLTPLGTITRALSATLLLPRGPT
ncbi:hypothetical protein MRX96_020202 [Rhipicephalus microplus]